MMKSQTKEFIIIICISILIASAVAGALTSIVSDREKPVELSPPVSYTVDKQVASIPDHQGEVATLTQEPTIAPAEPADKTTSITPTQTTTPQVTPTYWNDARATPDGYPSGIGNACCVGKKATCTPTPASMPAPATTICIPFGRADSPCSGY